MMRGVGHEVNTYVAGKTDLQKGIHYFNTEKVQNAITVDHFLEY
jgi:hypothetical protein